MSQRDYETASSSAAELIQQMLAGEISFDECEELWPQQGGELQESMDAAYHALIHFDADGDIRAKDAAYDDYQRRELEDISRRLGKGECLSAEQLAWLTPRWEFSPGEWWDRLRSVFRRR